VTNATQHADPGSAVMIAIEHRGDATRITVANRGPAISPGAQKKLWDRFYTTRAQHGGSGIGLSIVRAVAIAHGGTVGVRCAGGITEIWFEVS
jgi:signal transduction histidine kinase